MYIRHTVGIHVGFGDDASISAASRNGTKWIDIGDGVSIFYPDTDTLDSFLSAISATAKNAEVES